MQELNSVLVAATGKIAIEASTLFIHKTWFSQHHVLRHNAPLELIGSLLTSDANFIPS